RCN
ncbi:ribonucleoside-diphosphate reductase 2 subunit alpha, partial [Escherichia coli 88.1467]